jgi:2',3'-cyclic-nucleotide 2'-phosphodiesterase (5'-nucleotidase family)
MIGFSRRAAAIAAAAGLAAGVLVAGGPATAGPPVFRLQLLHASDLEGGVAAIGRAPNFAAIIDKLEDAPDMDASLTVSAGDNVIPGPFFAAASDALIQPTLNSVYNTFYGLTPPAPVYDDLRAAGGRIDYSVMNVIDFDASALGNHEFDLGSEVLGGNIKSDLRGAAGPPADRWPGVQFPYLSANLNFAGDANLSTTFTTDLRSTDSYKDAPAASAPTPKIAPYAFAEQGGQKIGIVGATTPILQSISSPTGTVVTGPTTNDMPALAAVLQPAINTVLAGGANKIILLSHLQQISLETELAGLLTGVDIIVAGGSDTILANDEPLQPGDVADGPYPLIVTSQSSEPVAIVSTDGEYTYVGRLVVDFDADGILVAPDGTPLDNVNDLAPALNGPVRTTPDSVAELWGADDPFAAGTKGQLVQQLVQSVTGVVTAKDGAVFGETTVFIDGRRSEVRTQETTAGNLSADANLFVARQVDPTVQVSIKNGGGIRAEIGEVVNTGDVTEFLPPQANSVSGKQEGQISQLDIENSLRFNNSLTLLTTTAAGLKELLEHGVAATAPGLTPGQFPQIGGMAFSFDPTLPARTPTTAGQRIRSLVVGEGATTDVIVADGQVVGNANRLIRVVTLGFLATGGDSYPFPAVTALGSSINLTPANTPPGAATFADAGTEQDAFAEYLIAFHGIGDGTPFSTPDTPPAGDTRIRNLSAVTVTPAETSIVPVVPARLFDTRPAVTVDGQQSNVGRRTAASTSEVQVAGRGNVPTDAIAASVNVAAITAGAAGFLTLYPCGSARPEASTLNFAAGQTIANGATIKLGTGGKICVYSDQATDLIVDVTGYVPAGSTIGSVLPARLHDTRPAATVDGQESNTGRRTAGSTTTIQVGGRGNVPATAQAATVNVAAINAGAAGFLTLYPCGSARPEASTLNFAAGQTVANGATIKLSTGGTICVYSDQATDLILDVTGFVPAGSNLGTVVPARLFDSRPAATIDGQQTNAGRRAPGSTTEVTVGGRGNVPANALGAMVNVAAINAGAPGFLTLYPCGSARPEASTLNYATGQTIANGATIKLGTGGKICVFSDQATDLIVDVTGFVPAT